MITTTDEVDFETEFDFTTPSPAWSLGYADGIDHTARSVKTMTAQEARDYAAGFSIGDRGAMFILAVGRRG